MCESYSGPAKSGPIKRLTQLNSDPIKRSRLYMLLSHPKHTNAFRNAHNLKYTIYYHIWAYIGIPAVSALLRIRVRGAAAGVPAGTHPLLLHAAPGISVSAEMQAGHNPQNRAALGIRVSVRTESSQQHLRERSRNV